MRCLVSIGLSVAVATAYCPAASAEVAKPEIMAQSEWKDTPAVTQNMVPQEPKYTGVVIHHTQIAQTIKGWKKKTTEQKLRDIQRDHQKVVHNHNARPLQHRPQMNGKTWGDFAYHYFIDVDGKIAEGRNIRYEGDSRTNYKMTGLILVVLQGDFTKDTPTEAQRKSLDALVAWLAQEHSLDPKKMKEQLSGHGEHVATDCPGTNLQTYIDDELEQKTAAALGEAQ